MEFAERAYFAVCRTLGRALRTATYSRVGAADHRHVRKRRLAHAPALVRAGNWLLRVLDTGVQVLPQRGWEQRERRLYRVLHGATVLVEGDGALLLPRLPGATLAELLEDAGPGPAARRSAMTAAATALADFHRRGFTHGDAMAENVLIDRQSWRACWFDFETVHEPQRPADWRRADDVRALLATCLVRSAPGDAGDTLHVILDAYGDPEVERILAERFASAFQRPLVYHLGQAPLSFRRFREASALLRERPEGAAPPAAAGD